MTAALKRIAISCGTLVLASIVIFAVLGLLPGDAATIMLGTGARPDTIAAMTQKLGLDHTALQRYGVWALGLFHGDLGPSSTYGIPVGTLIAERLPVTLPLASIALFAAVAFGVPVGVAGALRPGGWADLLATVLSQIGIAVPDFCAGLLLILIFSTGLHWFSAGGFPGWWPDPLGAAKALLLPALALALPQAAVLTRVTRAAVLDVSHLPFVRTARSMGVPPARLVWLHIVPNALGPVLTIVGLQLSFLVAGAVLVESVFNLPGLGRLAIQSLAQRDLPVVRGIAMVMTGGVIAINGLVDLVVVRLDPRLRTR